MKKLLAMLLALVMALSCTAVLAEEPAEETVDVLGDFAFTLEAGVQVNADAILQLVAQGAEPDEATAAAVKNILAVVNELGLRFVLAGNAMSLDAVLKDSSILNVTAQAAGEDMIIAVDAIPDAVLTVKGETVQALLEQVMAPLSGMSNSSEALAEIGAKAEALLEAIASKVGEPETGEYTVNGLAFTTKVPVNITTKELVTLVLDFAKEVVENEGFAQIMQSIGQEIDPSSITSAMESLESQDEAEMPVTELAQYSDEKGNSCIALNMEKDGEALVVYAMMYDGYIILDADILGQGALNFQAWQDGNAYNLSLMLSGEQFGHIALNGSLVTLDEGEMALMADLTFNSEEPLLSIAARFVPKGEVAPISAEGKTAFALEDLMNDPEGEAAQQLAALAQSAISVVLGKAMQVMPDEFTTIMQMLSPSESAAVAAE